MKSLWNHRTNIVKRGKMSLKASILEPFTTLFNWSKFVGFPIIVIHDKGESTEGHVLSDKIRFGRRPHAYKVLGLFAFAVLMISPLALHLTGALVGMDTKQTIEFWYARGMTTLDLVFGQGVFIPPTMATLMTVFHLIKQLPEINLFFDQFCSLGQDMDCDRGKV